MSDTLVCIAETCYYITSILKVVKMAGTMTFNFRYTLSFYCYLSINNCFICFFFPFRWGISVCAQRCLVLKTAFWHLPSSWNDQYWRRNLQLKLRHSMSKISKKLENLQIYVSPAYVTCIYFFPHLSLLICLPKFCTTFLYIVHLFFNLLLNYDFTGWNHLSCLV